MADPVSIASGVSVLAGAGKSILGGIGNSQADAMQAQRSEMAAFAAKTNAYNTDNQYLTDTRKSLATIDAIRASVGDNPDSPTGIALRDEMQGAYDLRRTTAVMNLRDQSQQDLLDASYYKSKSGSDLLSGLFGGLFDAAGPVGSGLGNWFNGSSSGGGAAGSP